MHARTHFSRHELYLDNKDGRGEREGQRTEGTRRRKRSERTHKSILL
jgi:hypothetical protein